MAERNPYLDTPKTGEERIIVALFAVSILVHLIMYLVLTPGFLRSPMPVLEEWEIQTDLVADYEMASPDKDTLPDATEAEDAKVPETLLPQLPKKFAVDDQAKGETAVQEGEETKNEKTEEIAEKKEDEQVQPKQDQQEKNRLQKDDALRRLAIERLRLEQKLSSKMEAEKKDAIARLKEKAASNKDVNTAAAAGLTANGNRYEGILQAHIRRCYTVPTAYNLANADLNVGISIVVNERGGLMSSSILKTSGDKVFDDLAYRAVKDCSPLPTPPQKLAGVAITVNFNP